MTPQRRVSANSDSRANLRAAPIFADQLSASFDSAQSIAFKSKRGVFVCIICELAANNCKHDCCATQAPDKRVKFKLALNSFVLVSARLVVCSACCTNCRGAVQFGGRFARA